MEEAGGESTGALGTLFLVGRKTGVDVQSFPIDAARVTIGRDYECDIRLYFSDVSKLHCEIIFDVLTSKAFIHIHGGNGIRYTPAGGSTTLYTPPAVLPLSDRDTFVIRKKVFRFEYTNQTTDNHESGASAESPIRIPVNLPSPNKLIRKKASHRLSLVPAGKQFVPRSPAPSRRHSTFGVPNDDSEVKALSVEPDIDENAEDEAEELVDVVDGDEGDKVYLEEKVGQSIAARPIYNHAFMTPQQSGKAPLRNTSAVPRTRRQPAISNEQPIAIENVAPVSPRSIPLPGPSSTPYTKPETPVAITAKVALATPRGSNSLRKALLVKSARKVWETNRSPGVDGAVESGDIQVRRKSKSPNQSPRRTPKKSLTPFPTSNATEELPDIVGGPDSPSPQYHEATGPGEFEWIEEDIEGDMSVESSDSGGDSFEADMSLDIPGQGVMSFGTPKITIGHEEADELEDEGDSDEELDEGESEDEFEEDEVDQDEDEEARDVEDEEQEMEEQIINPGPRVQFAVSSNLMDVEENDGKQEPREDSDEEDDAEMDAVTAPGTPDLAPKLSKQFYTPQVSRRAPSNGPRRSLASFGPAVRFTPGPSTPDQHAPAVRFTPRALGRPSRVGGTFAPSTSTTEVEEVEDEDEVEVDSKPTVAATPRQLSRETMEKHQQTLAALATPRALPAPPAGGFRNRTRATPSFSLFKSPAHPVLAPTADSDSEQEQDGEGANGSVHEKKNELSDIKRKLNALRRKSILDVERREQRYNERRMTIGAEQPTTPARGTTSVGFYSVNPGRIAPQGQSHFARSPLEAATQEETTVTESAEPVDLDLPEDVELEIDHELDMAQEPEMDQPFGQDEQEDQVEVFSSPARTVHLADILPQKADEATAPSSDTSLSSSSPRRQPPTPSFAGVKGMLYPSIPLPPKTPNLSGVKSMLYPAVPTTSTPVYSGMRDLYQLPDTAQTPDLTGLKSLYGAPKGMSTPGMDGLRELREMYESEVASPQPEVGGTEGDEQNEPIDQVEVSEETQSEEEDEEIETVQLSVKSISAPTRRSATKAISAPTRRAITPVEEPTHIPAKRARAAVKKAEPSVSAPTRTRTQVASTSTTTTTARATASRARKAAIPAPPSTADEAMIDKPVTRTRATRATATVEAGVTSTASRARSAPTRGKAVLGERTDQTVDEEGPADKGKAKKTVAKTRSRKPEVEVKSASMPTRRRKVDQENVPEVKEAKAEVAAVPMVSRSAPTRRTATKAVEAEAALVVATRTRSRR